MCADEIHCDLVLPPPAAAGGAAAPRHTSFAALDGGRFAERTITLMAPSKTCARARQPRGVLSVG